MAPLHTTDIGGIKTVANPSKGNPDPAPKDAPKADKEAPKAAPTPKEDPKANKVANKGATLSPPRMSDRP